MKGSHILAEKHLHDGDVLVTSSEDLRCFFYLFRVPEAWCRFMGFGREIPSSMVPQGGEGKKWYTSAVPFYQWGTSTAWGWLNTSTGLESLRPWHLLGGLVSRYKRSGETAFSVTVQTFSGFTLTTSTNFKGAWVDGEAGTVRAKPTKVAKYIKLVLEIIGMGRAPQRELQVVGGGFVYIAMFRRPSLSF